MKPIDKLSGEYFICAVNVAGIPAQAAALLQPAEPDVGIPYESLAELLIYDRRGYHGGWLQQKLDADPDEQTHVEVQVQEALQEARMNAAADQYA